MLALQDLLCGTRGQQHLLVRRGLLGGREPRQAEAKPCWGGGPEQLPWAPEHWLPRRGERQGDAGRC